MKKLITLVVALTLAIVLFGLAVDTSQAAPPASGPTGYGYVHPYNPHTGYNRYPSNYHQNYRHYNYHSNYRYYPRYNPCPTRYPHTTQQCCCCCCNTGYTRTNYYYYW
ncbi:MAG: hypothetical protein D6768_05135 [Chloroflexi bacterium]|nr:MAG: hypothetical protein D6768_05135 [Chloroflexota bacterium]